MEGRIVFTRIYLIIVNIAPQCESLHGGVRLIVTLDGDMLFIVNHIRLFTQKNEFFFTENRTYILYDTYLI